MAKKKRLLALSGLSACPFVRLSACLSVPMEQLGSSWKDFCEMLYLNVFRKYVEKIQVSLKSDKNNEYFTWSQMHIYDISLNYF
jgi:hypothetical protein